MQLSHIPPPKENLKQTTMYFMSPESTRIKSDDTLNTKTSKVCLQIQIDYLIVLQCTVRSTYRCRGSGMRSSFLQSRCYSWEIQSYTGKTWIDPNSSHSCTFGIVSKRFPLWHPRKHWVAWNRCGSLSDTQAQILGNTDLFKLGKRNYLY